MAQREEVIEYLGECELCGARMVEWTNRRTGKPFLGCSRYPDCNYTREIPESIKMRRAGAQLLPGLE